MSEDPTPQSESEAPQTASDSPAVDRKPRSPAERLVVWGGIIVLLLLVGYQAHARLGYTMTLNRLEPLIDDDYQGAQPLPIAEVDSHVVGFPRQTNDKLSDRVWERTYRWHGLTGSYGITLQYNPEAEPPVVTSLVTDNPPEPEEPEIDFDDEELADMEEMDGPPMPGGGGGFSPPMHEAAAPGGGSGGGFNPMENDADGDGQLSREEAPERMRESFDEIDTNDDGFVDESEIEAMREQFRQFGGRDGRGEGGEERPQRPSVEGADDADAPAEEGATTDDSAPAEAADEESAPADAAPAEAGADAADTP